MKRGAMSSLSSKSSDHYKIRSISLPTRSHPTTSRAEQELNKLRTWEDLSPSRVKSIYNALFGLADLYKCTEDLLKLPLTQQALAHHQNEKWVSELLDDSLSYLDLSANLRDAISLLKDSVRELQSAIRRNKVGDLGIEANVSKYASFRRKVRKESTKSLLLLKQMDCSSGVNSAAPLDLNNHLCAVLRVVREASLITSSIFYSLLQFLCTPVLKPRPTNRWSFVSRLVQKGVLGCNNQQEGMNELERVDGAIGDLLVESNLSKDVEAEKTQCVLKKLEALDEKIEGLENGLECLFRHLISTRVAFLNMLSS